MNPRPPTETISPPSTETSGGDSPATVAAFAARMALTTAAPESRVWLMLAWSSGATSSLTSTRLAIRSGSDAGSDSSWRRARPSSVST